MRGDDFLQCLALLRGKQPEALPQERRLRVTLLGAAGITEGRLVQQRVRAGLIAGCGLLVGPREQVHLKLDHLLCLFVIF